MANVSLRPGETPQQAQERRMRESQQVEERVVHISDLDDWDKATQASGNDLVVVEVRVHRGNCLQDVSPAFIVV